jgi:hypothetical protein
VQISTDERSKTACITDGFNAGFQVFRSVSFIEMQWEMQWTEYKSIKDRKYPSGKQTDMIGSVLSIHNSEKARSVDSCQNG